MTQYIHKVLKILKPLALGLLALFPLILSAQQLSEKYTDKRPIVIVGDWDKPPYEFLNDNGQPAGTNIDMLKAVFKELKLPYRFVLKEWGNALKQFERGDADLILANLNRYLEKPYFVTQNIINYNCIRVVSKGKEPGFVTRDKLLEEGVALKPNDFTWKYFNQEDPLVREKLESQSPKVALMGILAGDIKNFAWGEEPLKWKLKELNIKGMGLVLNEVDIPASEIHVIGFDRELIYEIDDQYSRLKQNGEIERINNRWIHPELVQEEPWQPNILLPLLGVFLLAGFYVAFRLARRRVKNETRQSTNVTDMMMKALHMGNFLITEYDIANDLMVNRYGTLLPERGITLEEFTSKIAPEEQQEFREKLQLMKKGRLRKTDLCKHWNAGTTEQPVWLNFYSHAIVELDSSGRPKYVVNAIHDVSRDKDESLSFYELTKRHDRLFNMPHIAMSGYDKNGFLIDLNDAMKLLCKYDEPNSQRFWQSICIFDTPMFRNVITPESLSDISLCQHMDYPELDISKHIEVNIHPVLDDAGQLTNYFVSVMDVSLEYEHDRYMHLLNKEIMETHQQINTLEDKLRYILTSSNLYVWRLNYETKTIVYTRSLRIPEHSCTLQWYYDSVSSEEKEASLKSIKNPKLWLNGSSLTRHFHRSLLGTDNDDHWYDITGIPIFGEDGEITAAFGLLRDVTERVHNQQKLKRETERAENSGQQKSMFLASMTHELRTPLNSIVGFSDLLSTVDSPEDRREFIRIIRSNCDMLLRLINDILEASSIDDDAHSIEPVDVDFSKAFNDICQTLSKRVQDPNVTFIGENPYDTFLTRLDVGRLQQVATNFVTNAVKYTTEGHIKLGYLFEPNWPDDTRESHDKTTIGLLHLYCEDTGQGIPKEKQDSVFDRFVKLNDYVQGTGLGLNICKAIAERCGGSIGVDSEGEGHGSTFWIKIPCKRFEA